MSKTFRAPTKCCRIEFVFWCATHHCTAHDNNFSKKPQNSVCNRQIFTDCISWVHRIWFWISVEHNSVLKCCSLTSVMTKEMKPTTDKFRIYFIFYIVFWFAWNWIGFGGIFTLIHVLITQQLKLSRAIHYPRTICVFRLELLICLWFC